MKLGQWVSPGNQVVNGWELKLESRRGAPESQAGFKGFGKVAACLVSNYCML